MALRDLVVSSLDPGSSDSSPHQIIAKKELASAEEVKALVAEARKTLRLQPQKIWGPISKMAAYQVTSGLWSSKRNNVALLLHAHEASLGNPGSIQWLELHLQKAEEEIERVAQNRRRSAAIGTFSQSITFLEEVLEDDTTSFLVDVTGVQRSTARRWLSGGGSYRKAFTVCSVAKALFVLAEERGWGAEKTREWLYQPLSCGQTPRDLWKGFHFSIDSDLQAELRRLGLYP